MPHGLVSTTSSRPPAQGSGTFDCEIAPGRSRSRRIVRADSESDDGPWGERRVLSRLLQRMRCCARAFDKWTSPAAWRRTRRPTSSSS
eukprot:603765-Alexandrium_andersonii.AAC.1